jgi:FkbM family methyltransferase
MLAYDAGMNNGDDTRYYLKKGWDVVAIEADPSLCETVAAELREFVDAGRLKILNVAVADEDGTLEFHVDIVNSVRSSLKPNPAREMRAVEVPARKMSSLVAEHGPPDFMKIDVEHVDQEVLRELIDAGIKPPLISCEAHSFEILLLLWQMGYREFRLVNGRAVHLDYRGVAIHRADGTTEKYTFPRHSSGPFGDDLPIPWNDIQHVAAEWLHRRALFGSGWFDVHAR